METRGWDDGRQATYRMRAKETSDDYRYFPDPDLPPLRVEAAWIEARPCRAAGAPGRAPRAVRGARPRSVRRGGHRGRSGDDDGVRGDLVRGHRAREGGLELRDGRPRPGREGPWPQRDGDGGSLHPRGDRHPALRDRLRPGLTADRTGPAGPSPGGRHARGRAARRGRARDPSRTMRRCSPTSTRSSRPTLGPSGTTGQGSPWRASSWARS